MTLAARANPAVQITFEVNGADHTMVVEPRTTLADALRGPCGLTGTRVGCDEGACGSCTVLVDGEPVRACLMLAVQAHRTDVRTVEGLASDGRLHTLQAAFARHHAVQCGFCTPGFLMLALGALERGVPMDEARVREVMAANVCRCADYGALVSAVLAAAAEMRAADEA